MAYYARQHMKTVLFLGAGASVFAGMPTTKDLVNDVLHQVLHRETWDSPTASSLAKNIVQDHEDSDVEVLYRTIRDMKAAEWLHKKAMEYKMGGDNHPAWRREVLTTSRSHPDNKTIKDETEDIEENTKTLESLEVAIRNTLLGRLTIEPDRIKDMVERYDGLFGIVPPNIVTTNYDNVLETYCEKKGLSLVNGFKRSHLGDMRIWEGEGDGARYAGEGELRLVKLHGSITWQEDGGDVLETGRPGLRIHESDVMIYPTLGEKNYGDSIFPALWDGFEAMLAETELLIVAGFSFRDPKIVRMLRSRLERTAKNPNPLKMLYMDPNTDGLKELAGKNVEWRLARTERGELQHCYKAEMPYVYAHESKFPPSPDMLKLVLEILDEVSREDPHDRA